MFLPYDSGRIKQVNLLNDLSNGSASNFRADQDISLGNENIKVGN